VEGRRHATSRADANTGRCNEEGRSGRGDGGHIIVWLLAKTPRVRGSACATGRGPQTNKTQPADGLLGVNVKVRMGAPLRKRQGSCAAAERLVPLEYGKHASQLHVCPQICALANIST
jgi:hypothetical protein